MFTATLELRLPGLLKPIVPASTKLFWEGIWEMSEQHIPADIKETEGLFMVLAGKKTPDNKAFDPDSYRILYVGESKDIYAALHNGKQWKAWQKIAGKDSLLLKLAKTSPGMDRKIILNNLVFHLSPPCNRPLIAPPTLTKSVDIYNLGYKSPLEKSYVSS